MSVNVGDDILAATMNRLLNPPCCRIMQVTTGSTLVDSVQLALPFDTEDFDDFGMHSPSVNPSRITITSAAGDGKYLFRGTLHIAARSDYNTIGCVIGKNGTNQPPWQRVGPSSTSQQRSVSITTTLAMVVGDYVEFSGYQDNVANASVATAIGSSFESVFECLKISD